MARLWGVFTALCVILSLFTVAYGQGTGQKGKQTEAGDVIPGKGTKSGDVISGKSTEGGDVIRGKGTEGGDVIRGKGTEGGDTEGGDVIPAKGTKGGDVISGKGTKGGEVIPSKGTEAGDVIPAKGTEGGDVIPSKSKFPSLSMLIKHRPPVKRSRNVCKRPKKVGRCRARFPRFYFDSASGLCVAFFYGGCGSNRNNFKTRKECARRCGCRLPAKPGRCKAAFPRYYYKWGKCVSFTYGGCNPNENNFLSKKSCLAVCR